MSLPEYIAWIALGLYASMVAAVFLGCILFGHDPFATDELDED